jgi:transposase
VREARAMKAAGRTVRQIAKHFDIEKATVEKWLTKEK